MDIETNKTIVTTQDANVLCNNQQNSLFLAPCTHVKADTRMFLHLEDAVRKGHTTMFVRMGNSDVLVLAITSLHLNFAELWIPFGVGETLDFFCS